MKSAAEAMEWGAYEKKEIKQLIKSFLQKIIITAEKWREQKQFQFGSYGKKRKQRAYIVIKSIILSCYHPTHYSYIPPLYPNIPGLSFPVS